MNGRNRVSKTFFRTRNDFYFVRRWFSIRLHHLIGKFAVLAVRAPDRSPHTEDLDVVNIYASIPITVTRQFPSITVTRFILSNGRYLVTRQHNTIPRSSLASPLVSISPRIYCSPSSDAKRSIEISSYLRLGVIRITEINSRSTILAKRVRVRVIRIIAFFFYKTSPTLSVI